MTTVPHPMATGYEPVTPAVPTHVSEPGNKPVMPAAPTHVSEPGIESVMPIVVDTVRDCGKIFCQLLPPN